MVWLKLNSLKGVGSMKKEIFLCNIFSFIIFLGFSGVAEALGRKSKFENMSLG